MREARLKATAERQKKRESIAHAKAEEVRDFCSLASQGSSDTHLPYRHSWHPPPRMTFDMASTPAQVRDLLKVLKEDRQRQIVERSEERQQTHRQQQQQQSKARDKRTSAQSARARGSPDGDAPAPASSSSFASSREPERGRSRTPPKMRHGSKEAKASPTSAEGSIRGGQASASMAASHTQGADPMADPGGGGAAEAEAAQAAPPAVG